MALGFSPDNGALTTDLTHYYNTNSDFTDSKGSNNGTDVNTPTYTSGKISNAFTCVSTSSQYTQVANNTFPWATNILSVNLWVKLAATAGNQSWVMVARSGQGLNIYKASTDVITFSKPNVADCNYSWAAIDTSYHMWTFVLDGANGMKTYLDGNSTPVATHANTANIVDPAGDTIPFGAYKSGGAIQADWYLNGQEDEIGIWTKALSTTEIADLYNSGAGNAYRELATGATGNFFLMFNN